MRDREHNRGTDRDLVVGLTADIGGPETMTTSAPCATERLDAELLAEALRHALDGVAVVESNHDGTGTRLAYGNATLAALLRRPEEWLPGRTLDDIEIEAAGDPNLTNAGVGVRVRLKRVDGSTIECERWVAMLSNARVALYYRPLPQGSPGRACRRARAFQRSQHGGAVAGHAESRLVDRPARRT